MLTNRRSFAEKATIMHRFLLSFLVATTLLARALASSDLSTEMDGPCDNYECCFDCICCGPGTKWNDLLELCIPHTAGPDPIPFDWSDKCYLPKCTGADCCDKGTQLMTDPTRDADACWCVVEPPRLLNPPTPNPTMEPVTEPTMSPQPTSIDSPSPSMCPLPERYLSFVVPDYRPEFRRLAATCKDPNGLNLAAITAPAVGQLGATTTFVSGAGNHAGTRVSNRLQENQKKSFLFGASCECVDVVSYRIEVYEIANNPWEWVHVHMSYRRRCCSTDPALTVNQACRCIPGGFEDNDTYENGESFFFDPRNDSDRDLLSDIGSAASILALVIAIALPGPP